MVAFLSFKLYEKYSFTSEKVDLTEYIGVSGDDVAIYLNDVPKSVSDEGSNYFAIKEHDATYLPLSFVKEFINNRFYYAKDVSKMLYCLPDEVKSFGDTDMHQMGNAPYVVFRDEPYLLIDYVKDYSNIRYDMYLDDEAKRVYVYTDWDKEDIGYLKSREAVRVQGGNKSKVITTLRRGEEIKILDQMTKWYKVKTSDGYIGYIRKSKIGKTEERIPTSDYIEFIRPGNKLQNKVCLGFHQVFSVYSTANMPTLLKYTEGMNVIAPTWLVIRSNEGALFSNASDAYVQYCHNKGLSVWATVNNFDMGHFDDKKIFSSTKNRRSLIERIVREVTVNGLDGINLDIEKVPTDAGEDYTEFVRELSIELTNIGCILSIDTYVPYAYNSHYDLKEYNDFCDYVIIMCYDEHYAGSKEAGSVSSIGYVRDGINLSLVDVDKDKLIIALPFYTRVWTTLSDGSVGSIVGGSLAMENSARKSGLTFAFDDATCQNYGIKTGSDGSKIECWLEDELSLAYKTTEIKNADLAGTAAWKLGQERETFFSIININE
ncbi:MAG: SH3 domain-containing protein [Lachnospiraceae bacterium]|nr:SH3 domain-containing protein [Lachnospiraceae bacterium]